MDQLGEQVFLPKDLGSILGTHMAAQAVCNSGLREFDTIFWLIWEVRIHVIHRRACR